MAPERLRLAISIEKRIGQWAEIVSWLWLALIAIIVVTVILRYALGTTRIELEELEWHLYAVGFLMGIVACTARDRHVRVDVFRERMSPRARAWVDLYGILLLQIPFLLLVLWSAGPFVLDSFLTNERSAAAGGLSHRWILKAALPVSFGLLGLATLARLLRVLDALFGDRADDRARESSP